MVSRQKTSAPAWRPPPWARLTPLPLQPCPTCAIMAVSLRNLVSKLKTETQEKTALPLKEKNY